MSNPSLNLLNYYLIYISRAKIEWRQEELQALLQKSWNSNKEKNISGMLVFLQDKFIQLLEGPKEAVLATFDLIRDDTRHENITKLLEGQSDEPIFNDWSMGFKHLNMEEFQSMSGFRDPSAFFSDDTINNHSHPALIFLKLFYDKNYRDYQLIMR